MSPRPVFAACLLAALPFAAAAQPAACPPLVSDQARLDCDLLRAKTISADGERLFGPAAGEWLTIVDTGSPSGLSYVYQVTEEKPYLLLEARAIPGADSQSTTPACRLRTTLPLDTADAIRAATANLISNPPMGYGSREEVRLNPDGSRSIRLIVDSRDIVTRIQTGDAVFSFSRLASATDEVTHLNNLVIGVANFSSDWNCESR